MKPRQIHRLGLLAPLPIFCALVLACSGATGPAGLGGGPGGAAVGENSGGGPIAAAEVGFNPGPIQAGGEGHGQETRKFDNVVFVGTKDGRSNCGVRGSEMQVLFPAEATQPALMSWASGFETGPFGALQERSMGGFGRVPLPQCPLVVMVQTDQFQTRMTGKFLKLVATYTDSSGNFFQSEPHVMPCPPTCVTQPCPAICAEPPCEVCLNLKAESEIAEEDRVRQQTTLPSPVDFELPSLPGIEERGLVNPRLRLIEGS